MSVLSSAASGKRKKQVMDGKADMKLCSHMIGMSIKDCTDPDYISRIVNHTIHEYASASASASKLAWTSQQRNLVEMKGLAKVFKERSHGTFYFNPLSIPLGVGEMGLSADDVNFIKYVAPGATVVIPTTYTFSSFGNSSLLHRITPQLKPVAIERDCFLDIIPITYEEWIMHYPLKLTGSACCSNLVYWSDFLGTTACNICGKPCAP